MLDLVDQLIGQRLSPLVERIAELEGELEDLRRRADGHIRVGTITAVDPAAGRCKVGHGENASPWIKYFNPAAGGVSETRHPSAGEQCLLLNFGAGDGSAQAYALCGLPTTAYPPASSEAHVHRRRYPDGTVTDYDHQAHRLTWTIGPTTIAADREQLVLACGPSSLTLTLATATLASNGESLTLGAGAAGIEAPSLTHNGTNVGATHVHTGVQSGPSTTGAPQ